MKKVIKIVAGLLFVASLLFVVSGCEALTGGKERPEKLGDKDPDDLTDETGTIGITVNITTANSCDICGTTYQTAEAKAACTKHFTINFVDSANKEKKVTHVIPSGKKVNVPDWKQEGKGLFWTSDSTKYTDPTDKFETTETMVTVTFTSKWATAYPCAVCKHNYETQAEADNCARQEGCPGYKVKCDFCDKTYSTDSEADACTHHVCDTCGTAYKTAAEKDACADHVTVTFVDSANVETTVTRTIKKGTTTTAPDWKKEGSNLSWNPAIPESISSNTEFTTVWSSKPTCTNCGAAYDTDAEAAACGNKTGCPSFVSSWTAETSTTIPGWLKGLSEKVVEKKDYNAFGLTKHIALAAKASITVIPSSVCKIKVYIANDNNSANKGTVEATVDGVAVGSKYNLPHRKDSSATPMVVDVTAANVGKEFVFTPTYNSLVYKVEFVTTE